MPGESGGGPSVEQVTFELNQQHAASTFELSQQHAAAVLALRQQFQEQTEALLHEHRALSVSLENALAVKTLECEKATQLLAIREREEALAREKAELAAGAETSSAEATVAELRNELDEARVGLEVERRVTGQHQQLMGRLRREVECNKRILATKSGVFSDVTPRSQQQQQQGLTGRASAPQSSRVGGGGGGGGGGVAASGVSSLLGQYRGREGELAAVVQDIHERGPLLQQHKSQLLSPRRSGDTGRSGGGGGGGGSGSVQGQQQQPTHSGLEGGGNQASFAMKQLAVEASVQVHDS
jgi:hypothetical protein